MGWLRRQRDAIALVLAWALLLQSLLVALSTAAEAAAALAGSDSSILCTTNGTAAPKDTQQPKQTGHRSDCCSLACRAVCAGGSSGMAPDIASLPLPPERGKPVAGPADAPRHASADLFAGKPRGPPTA